MHIVEAAPDLALVTQTLLNLLQAYLKDAPAGKDRAIDVLPFSPTGGARPRLGFSLFHVSKDPDMEFAGSLRESEIGSYSRRTPMALILHYQLRAHAPGNPLLAQTMMGLAMQALHNHHVIKAGSNVGDRTLFPPGLAEHVGELRVRLAAVDTEQIGLYWATGPTSMHPTAYYRVNVTLRSTGGE